MTSEGDRERVICCATIDEAERKMVTKAEASSGNLEIDLNWVRDFTVVIAQ